jgi:hypothetical protein
MSQADSTPYMPAPGAPTGGHGSAVHERNLLMVNDLWSQAKLPEAACSRTSDVPLRSRLTITGDDYGLRGEDSPNRPPSSSPVIVSRGATRQDECSWPVRRGGLREQRSPAPGMHSFAFCLPFLPSFHISYSIYQLNSTMEGLR